MLSIRDEEILATAKAYGIDIPISEQSAMLLKIRERMLTLTIGQAIAFCWKEHQDQLNKG